MHILIVTQRTNNEVHRNEAFVVSLEILEGITPTNNGLLFERENARRFLHFTHLKAR